MTPAALIPLAIYLVTLIFAAGGAWVRSLRVAKDVNGIGRKVNALEKKDRDARVILALWSLATTPEQKALIEKIVGD